MFDVKLECIEDVMKVFPSMIDGRYMRETIRMVGRDYSYSDVKHITGVHRLRLHHWIKDGFFVPANEVSKGSGTRNIYIFDDLVQITLLKKLIETGIHGRTAAILLREYRESTLLPSIVQLRYGAVSITIDLTKIYDEVRNQCLTSNSKALKRL